MYFKCSKFALYFSTISITMNKHNINKFQKLVRLTWILIFSAISITSLAQVSPIKNGSSSLNMSQLSDQQIIQIWQQTQRQGMSESEGINALIKQGLSPSDVNAFKKRLLQIQSGSKGKYAIQNTIKDTSEFMKDSSWVLVIPQVKKQSNIYGFDFFSNPNPSFEPNLRISTPQNYILGPDDVLSISLTGLNERIISAVIDPQGNTNIPFAGIVNLNGLSIEQATQKLKLKLKSVYPAIEKNKTFVQVTLSNIKSIRITIIGEAIRPGNYEVSSLATLYNLLYLSGGPSQNGSLRNIELIRNNKIVQTFDFYTFLQKGIIDNNFRLQDQDVIRFPIYVKRASINGAVKNPLIYELLEKETLQDLIKYAGGFADSASNNPARVIQLSEKDRVIKDIPVIDFNNYLPHNADSIYIDKISNIISNKVFITGAVYQPGSYEQMKGLTVSSLIHSAGGIIQNVTITKGIIKRNINASEKELLAFNVNDLLTKKINDIKLLQNDSIFIIAKDGLQDDQVITVSGFVRKPGSFVFHKGMTIEDIIVLAGGFSINADNNKVQLSRLQKNKSDTLANQLLSVISVAVDSSLKSNSSIQLEPFDYIQVPELLNYHVLGTVKVRGEVLYPGDYRLEKRNETIQDLLKSAGGISPYAKLNDVQVFRNNLRVATNLLGENNKVENQFLLQPNDSIYIPKDIPFVEVRGAVFNPEILSYESSSLSSYISKAGGPTDKAYLKRAYVQYGNGINKKTRHFLFLRFYPRILPGSKIIIPEKTPDDTKRLSVVELSAVAGILTSLVTLAISLKL